MVARLKLKGIDGRAPPGVDTPSLAAPPPRGAAQALLLKVDRPGVLVPGKAAASRARGMYLPQYPRLWRYYRIAGNS